MPANKITLKQQILGMFFAAPYLVGLLMLGILPLLMSLYYSFTEYPMLQPPMWIGLDNYKGLWSDPVFHKVLINTLLFAAGSVPLSLTASVLLAVLLNQAIIGKAFFRTVVFLPSLIPEVGAAMLWLWVLNGKQGLLNVVVMEMINGFNRLLFALHMPELQVTMPNWLGVEALVKPVFIFLGLYGIGNAVIIFLAGLQDIPMEMYEAARIDGASSFQQLRHITLPMLSPVIFFNLVMGIIGSWQVFGLPYIMVGSGVNRAGYFYSQYLFDAAFMQLRMGYASAMAWIQFAIIMSLTAVVIISSKRWVHYR